MITLDADTRLPRGAARRLVGKMAHPLNRPRLDPRTRPRGRGVRRPAAARHADAADRPRGIAVPARLLGSVAAWIPYAFAVSDVYQDLLGEGSYTGKGIYDVDVFEAALDGRVPENTLLSHDLLEGIFARAGLVSDIEVVEEFPSRYDVAAARQHRWARGDWQLLPWIFGRGRDAQRRPGTQGDPVGRPLEDDGQPAPHAVGAGRVPRLAGRAGPCRSVAAARVERVRARDDRAARPPALSRRHRAATARDLEAQPLARGRRGSGARAVADRLPGGAPRASGVVDGRRHRANAGPSVRERAGTCSSGSPPRRRSSACRSTFAASTGGWPAASRWPSRPRSSSPASGTVAWPIAAPFVLVWLLSPVIAQWASRPPPRGRARRPSPPRTRTPCG